MGEMFSVMLRGRDAPHGVRMAPPPPGLRGIAAQFPALAQRIHGEPLAYLDNAATTHVPESVLAAVGAFERHDRANIHRGVHTLSQRATDAFEGARSRLKRFIGADDAHELVFTSGTTDALNLVANGLSSAGTDGQGDTPAWIRRGDEIVVSGLEHHANLVPWQQVARRTGAILRVLKPDALGRVSADALTPLLSARTRVFALTACSNATGYRPPYESLLALAAEAGALTVLDAAQAVGHGALGLSTLECDFVAFSGHKMYGPMGIGALAGRRRAIENLVPLRFGGDMVTWVGFDGATFAELPARLEGGTPNVAGAVGMAAAADFIASIGRARIEQHFAELRARALSGLSRLPGVRVLAPDTTSSAIISFVADDVHPHDMGTLLDEAGIAVRTGYHCAQPLLDHLGVGPTTRASFAVYNTLDDVDRLIAAVARALKVLR